MATKKPLEVQYPLGGYRGCLKCGSKFFSTNLTTNRICKKCNRENRSARIPKVYRTPDTPGGMPASEDC